MTAPAPLLQVLCFNECFLMSNLYSLCLLDPSAETDKALAELGTLVEYTRNRLEGMELIATASLQG